MTTIVFDGKTLACDGQVTVEERSAATQYRKIHTPPEGTTWKLLGEDVKAFGLAGDVAALQSVRQELTLERFGGIERGGVRFETTYPEQIDFIVLAVLTDGRVIDASKCKDNKYASYVFVEPPYAIGSGAHYALGALGAGVDAPTAVEVAKRYDLYSGGQTQTLKPSSNLAAAAAGHSRTLGSWPLMLVVPNNPCMTLHCCRQSCDMEKAAKSLCYGPFQT